MVVLSAGLCTKSGKVLFARNFVDISKVRIEGLLAAFPKLVGSGAKQHTFVETETVRYVYQTMESLYLLLITNKQSNIIEDLDTLSTLAKLIQEYCHSFSEEEVIKSSFDLAFAFDEVVSLGFKNNVSLQQVKTFIEMDSHEERIQEIIKRNQEKEARENARQKAKQLDRARSEQSHMMKAGGLSSAFMSGMPMLRGGSRQPEQPRVELDSHGLPLEDAARIAQKQYEEPDHAPKLAAPRGGGGGMKLGGGAPAGKSFVDALRDEGAIDEHEPTEDVGAETGVATPAKSRAIPEVKHKPVHLACQEKISVILNKDGGCDSMEVKGDLTVNVGKGANAQFFVKIRAGQNTGFQFKTHPKINKGKFAENQMLTPKDATKGFPVATALEVLRWRYMVKEDESMVPLSINCWPNANADGTVSVNIEYEANLPPRMELRDVHIMIPVHSCGDSQPPVVNHVDGQFSFDPSHSILYWSIDLIDHNSLEGSMDIVVPGISADSFFPVGATFVSPQTLCDIAVDEVMTSDGSQPVDFSSETVLMTETYKVQ